MWREFVREIFAESEFHPPTCKTVISVVEDALKVQIPEELSNLLCETNGIDGEHGLSLVWSIERIEEDNLRFRTNPDFKDVYMPFDNLLFFADAGTGDQFAFVVCNGRVRRHDIFLWNHEDDSRMWVAPSLRLYLDWWLNGKIKF